MKNWCDIAILAVILLLGWHMTCGIVDFLQYDSPFRTTASANNQSEWEQRERLVKAEQEQAKALQSIAASLKIIQRKN